jgi:hypothetical protein
VIDESDEDTFYDEPVPPDRITTAAQESRLSFRLTGALSRAHVTFRYGQKPPSFAQQIFG